jgi:type II secretory pathway pseudopilin PulG
MELMLVMAIIVIAGSLTVPAIWTMLSITRQSAAGDQVRAQLAETRARAMDEGRPYRLGYVPGTGIFQIAPEDSPAWDQIALDTYQDEDVYRDSLPEGIVFAKSEEDITQGNGSPGSSWETIAVYLPAGNARDDGFTYFGLQGAVPMRVEVRGLTGAVDIQEK